MLSKKQKLELQELELMFNEDVEDLEDLEELEEEIYAAS